MAHIEQVAGTQIPTLYLALGIHPLMAVLFSIIIVLGVYAAVVPLLWIVSSLFSNSTSRFWGLTLCLALIGAFIGLEIPFNCLVNIVYVINGHVGICLLLLMVRKDISLYRADKATMRPINPSSGA